MRGLGPLLRLDTRRTKVALHYFRQFEAWWEIGGQARDAWSRDHRVLDEAGALREGGWLDIEGKPPLVEVFDRGHSFWFATAQQAFAAGEPHVHEEPDKRYFIGEGGVLAVVAKPDESPSLVTAFRPDPPIPGNPVGETATRAYLKTKKNAGAFRRAAVRRLSRGTYR